MGCSTEKLDPGKGARRLKVAVEADGRRGSAPTVADPWAGTQWTEEETRIAIATADSLARQTIVNATVEAVTGTKLPTNRSLLEIVESDCALLAKKQADYANSTDPWLNFRESAEFVSRVRGVQVSALDVAYMLLGLKVSRLKNLGTRAPSNESRLDTLQDLRGYSAIIQAMEEETHG